MQSLGRSPNILGFLQSKLLWLDIYIVTQSCWDQMSTGSKEYPKAPGVSHPEKAKLKLCADCLREEMRLLSQVAGG